MKIGQMNVDTLIIMLMRKNLSTDNIHKNY